VKPGGASRHKRRLHGAIEAFDPDDFRNSRMSPVLHLGVWFNFTASTCMLPLGVGLHVKCIMYRQPDGREVCVVRFTYGTIDTRKHIHVGMWISNWNAYAIYQMVSLTMTLSDP